MSECPFCGTAVSESAFVCRGCGAEKVQGYVSQQTIKFFSGRGNDTGYPHRFFCCVCNALNTAHGYCLAGNDARPRSVSEIKE